MQLTGYDPSHEEQARALMIDFAKRLCQDKIDKAQGEAEKNEWLLKHKKQGEHKGKDKGTAPGSKTG